MKTPFFSLLATLTFGCLTAFGQTCAEKSAASSALTVGTASDPATGSEYTVNATGDNPERLREIQFHITRVSTENKTTTHATSDTTLRTGKSKTVGEVKALLSEVFGKFLRGAPTGTVLGKLGAVDKGGEVLFVAESQESLRFDFITQGQPASARSFSRADITALAGILAPKN